MVPPVTNEEDVKRAMLQEAIVTLGRLLPIGMTVSFYRNPDDPRTIVESKYADGEVTHHYFTGAMH